MVWTALLASDSVRSYFYESHSETVLTTSGDTKALASVSGPIEVRLAAEKASKATFEVIVRPLSGLSGKLCPCLALYYKVTMYANTWLGTESKALATSLRSALLPSIILTNNPRTLIQLVAQSLTPLQNYTFTGPRSSLRLHPSLVASIINASTLALLNTASFPMRGVVCAVAVGRIKDSHTLVVDPSEDELPKLNGGGTFAFLTTSLPNGSQTIAQLVYSSWNAAPFREEELMVATALAQGASSLVYEKMKEAVGHLSFGTAPIKSVKKVSQVQVKEEIEDGKMEMS